MTSLTRVAVIATCILAANTAAFSAEKPGPAGAYLVFEVDASGAIRPLHVSRTRSAPPTPRPIHHRSREPDRATDAVAVTVRDGSGKVIFEDLAYVARFVRGEFHAGPGATIDAHHIAAGVRAFAARIPLVAGASLELDAREARSRAPSSAAAFATPAPSFGAFDLDTLMDPADEPSRHAAGNAAATRAAATAPGHVAPLPGWDHGSPSNRVDLLVVGDGYTTAEQSKFENDALAVIEGMFELSPYREYRNYVNVHALFLESAQSGADQPPYVAGCSQYSRAQSCCGDPSAPTTGATVTTALDAAFCSFNVQRLLTVDTGKVLTAAAASPEWDQILVIVNTTRYGGSGGSFSVISTHDLAVEIAQHEYGHTFTRLADEYSSAYPGYPSCSDVEPGLPACERNVTDETRREEIKWIRWIDPGQAIPSTSTPPVLTDAGLWLGARYRTSGMYRQGYICTMRALGFPFCDVASEAYVLRLAQGSWGVPTGGIDLIEPGSESPPPGNTAVAFPGAVFSAEILGPQAGPDLDVRWLLDDAEVDASTAPTGSRASFPLEATAGLHRLELRVTDRSPIVHESMRQAVTRSRVWTVMMVPETTTTLPTTTTLGVTTSTSLPPTTLFSSTTTTTTTSSSTTTTSTTATTTMPPTTTTSTTLGPTTTLPTTTTLGVTTTSATTSTTTLADSPRCAQPATSDPQPRASDCLYILNAAVGALVCVPECICAPKGSLPTTASDALLCLGITVGVPLELRCPCGPLP